MKIRNLTKILVLALSLALLMTAAIGITASAEGEEVVDNRGDIYSTSIVHNDKIGIAIAVKATAEEIANNTVTVKYQWADEAEPKTATYFGAHETQEGYVWVVTEGVAAYDLAREATITSYLNENQVESGKYSVATFLYTKLYKDGVTGAAQECYEALLAYGAASQTFLNQNADAPVNALDYAYTNNADVKINGAYSVLGKTSATLTYNGTADLIAWVINGETVMNATNNYAITVDGIVEVDVVAGDMTIAVNGKSFSATKGNWLYNTAVTTGSAANYDLIIYDKNFQGSFTTNSYGAALVFNKYGQLIKVYDGANGWFYSIDNVSTGRVSGASVGFTTSTYATFAWEKLEEGETLVICPNDGTNASDSPRSFALALRNINGNGVYVLVDGEHPYFGKVATISGLTFEALPQE